MTPDLLFVASEAVGHDLHLVNSASPHFRLSIEEAILLGLLISSGKRTVYRRPCHKQKTLASVVDCQFHHRMNFPSSNREDGFSGLGCVTENKPVSASRYYNYPAC